MKILNPQIQTILNKSHGREPIILLEVQWVEDGPRILYSDQTVIGAKPTIVSINNFEVTLTVDGINESDSIEITLDDSDGILKSLIDTTDIHHRKVWLYLCFKGISPDYKILLSQGQITSPIAWSEESRSLSFTVLTQLEDIDVGFAMEEGDFPAIPEDALGKPWPLVFGTVCNMQTVQITSPRRGILVQGEGIKDFTLEQRLCQARKIMCDQVELGTYEETVHNNTWHFGLKLANYVGATTWTDGCPEQVDTGEESTSTRTTVLYGIDTECVNSRMDIICNLLNDLQQQSAYEHNTITILGGENFPQNQYITLYSEGAKFRGTFSGNTFTITDREHPEYISFEHQYCHDVPIAHFEYEQNKYKLSGVGWRRRTYDSPAVDVPGYEPFVTYVNIGPPETLTSCLQPGDFTRKLVGGAANSRAEYEKMDSVPFFWLPAGSEVYLEEESELLHIVSLLPGTVHSVAAYKKVGNKYLLMEVPAEYYTVYETDYTGYDVVEIGLEQKLSLIDANWEDGLYVTFTSSVGPNPVDIIEWLITKYTSINIDTTSFTAVKTALTNYPCNFVLKDKKNIFELIKDIAYQSRCAIYVRDNTIFIKYLSLEPTSLRTLTEKDILKFNLTYTEEVKTKHIINWKKQEAAADKNIKVDNKIILKHNVKKYGVFEEEKDYYTQNTYSTILKSSTFWLIRESNYWRKINFTTTLSQFDLDIFDCVTVATNQFNGRCVIEKVTFNVDQNTINFEGWTPYLAGKNVEYLWAWPANQNALAKYPTDEDEHSSGYDFIVTPPLEHILRGGVEDTNNTIYTEGDEYPSDLDDVLPTVDCSISDIVNFEIEEPIFRKLENLIKYSNDIFKSSQPRKEDDKCDPQQNNYQYNQEREDDDPPPGCSFYMDVYYWTVKTVVRGPGPCKVDGCGTGCTYQNERTERKYFSNYPAAEAYYNEIRQQRIAQPEECCVGDERIKFEGLIYCNGCPCDPDTQDTSPGPI